MTNKRLMQYRRLLQKLRQQVVSNKEIERRDLIQKVKNHLGIHEGLSDAALRAKEDYVRTMWM